MKNDLISRQALCEYALNQKDKSITPNDIMRFPAAQPETHKERTETHACDLISRQAALDAILAVTGNSSVRELYEHVQEHGLSDMWSGGVNAAIDIIIAVPSAHPYTNEEIQAMQDLEQAQLDKAYELGWKEGREAFRQAAIDAIKTWGLIDGLSEGQAIEILADEEKLPSAQPEIIYCGDCKYKDDGIDEDGIPFLKCLHGRSYGGTRINDFCSWAERRTDG